VAGSEAELVAVRVGEHRPGEVADRMLLDLGSAQVEGSFY
jgi:hypothetical protein